MKTPIEKPEGVITVSREFSPDIAKDIGVDAAIIFQNIVYWIGKNKANEKHFYDGRWWTYNTQKAFTELFPWLTRRKIRTCLSSLEKKGYIKTGNYNKIAYDRTTWYSVGENPIGQIWHMHWLETTNDIGYKRPMTLATNDQPIPNSNTNISSSSSDKRTTTTEKKVGESTNKVGSKLTTVDVKGNVLEVADEVGDELNTSQLIYLQRKHRLTYSAIKRIFKDYLEKTTRHDFRGFDGWLASEKSITENDKCSWDVGLTLDEVAMEYQNHWNE